jgi:hypothetical protein
MLMSIYILSDTFDNIRTRSKSKKENNYLNSYLYVSDRIQFIYIPSSMHQTPDPHLEIIFRGGRITNS